MLPNKRLKLAANDYSFTSAPQLKRDPLGVIANRLGLV
jgi:hypothetical protein